MHILTKWNCYWKIFSKRKVTSKYVDLGRDSVRMWWALPTKYTIHGWLILPRKIKLLYECNETFSLKRNPIGNCKLFTRIFTFSYKLFVLLEQQLNNGNAWILTQKRTMLHSYWAYGQKWKRKSVHFIGCSSKKKVNKLA